MHIHVYLNQVNLQLSNAGKVLGTKTPVSYYYFEMNGHRADQFSHQW